MARIQTNSVNNLSMLMPSLFTALGRVIRQDDIPIQTFWRMFRTNETVRSGILYIIYSVLAKLGEYTHEDKKIEEFIKNQWERMDTTLPEIALQTLLGLVTGFSVGEMCIESADGKYQLYDYQFIPPWEVELNIYDSGKWKNRISSITQRSRLGGQYPIDMNRAVLFTHNGFFGNVYGESMLRCAFYPWYMIDSLLPYWGTALEQHGKPVWLGKVGSGAIDVTDPVTGNKISSLDYMLELLRTIRDESVVACSGDDDIKNISPPVGFSRDFLQAVEYLGKMIYRALMLPSLVADNSTNTGSWALGEVHWKTWALSLDYIRNSLVECLLNQPIRRLITWNIGPQKNWGTFAVKSFDPNIAEILSRSFQNMTNSGFLDPSNQDDWDYVREAIGLPKRKLEVEKPVTNPIAEAKKIGVKEPGQEEGEGEDESSQAQDEGEKKTAQRESFIRSLMAGIEERKEQVFA